MKHLLDPDVSRSVGLIVPPSNPIAEFEIRQLLGDSLCLYTARLPYCPDKGLQERNDIYRQSYPDTAQRFGALKMQGILIACTGAQYKLGLEGDRRLCNDLSEQLGTLVITASIAIFETLQALGVKKLYLELPYPDWLLEQSKYYWQSGGFEIIETNRLLSLFNVENASQISSEQLEGIIEKQHAVKSHRRGVEDSAIVISGTGMVSVETMSAIGNHLQAPIVSSNFCGAKWLINQCKPKQGSELFDILLAQMGGANAVLPRQP